MCRYFKPFKASLKISELVTFVVSVSHLYIARVCAFNYEQNKNILHYPMANTNLYPTDNYKAPAATRIEHLDTMFADIVSYE